MCLVCLVSIGLCCVVGLVGIIDQFGVAGALDVLGLFEVFGVLGLRCLPGPCVRTLC